MVAQRADGLTVKNTFIDFEDDCFEEEDLNASMMGSWKKRQVSEPAVVFGRQLSSKPALGSLPEEPMLPGQPRQLLAFGEEDFNDGDSFEEPETETEPRPVPGHQFASHFHAATSPGASLIFNEFDAMPPWPQTQPPVTAPALGGSGYAPAMGFDVSPALDKVGRTEAMDLTAASYIGLQGEPHKAPPAPHFFPLKSAPAANPVAAPAVQDIPADWGETHTVMMRNLPNRYTQTMLVEEISHVGFGGLFDFLHLPIDPETNANKGYAFINFVDSLSSWRFKLAFEGKQMSRFNSNKYVSVSPAALQGFEANYAHYSTARCSRGNPAARPLFLREPDNDLNRRGPPSPAARRGGQRRRNHGRSLVDVAVQKQFEQQQRMTQAPISPQFQQATIIYGSQSQARGPGGARAEQHAMPPPSAVPSMAPPLSKAVAAAAVAEPSISARFCPFCGGSCQPNYRFCQFCGASLAAIGMN